MGEGEAIGGVEPQYTTAKTSVWWDIENCHVPKGCDPHAIAKNISSALVKMKYCGPLTISAYGDTTGIPFGVQHALSGTGIALNHVPAGAKDASDKKILVDMLFWAVDNPAPANYLLISGDRDFSNCLHQLRMRRYNILLAQPFKASPALVAAAKCVWHWTSLVYGGPPFSNGDLSDFSKASKTEMVQSFTNAATPTLETQKSSAPPNPNKANITRTTSLPVNLEEGIPVKKFMRAPHEFFSAPSNAVPSTLSSNSYYPTDNLDSQLIQPQPPYVPDKLISPISHANTLQPVSSRSDGHRPSVALPDTGNLCVPGNPSFSQSEPVFKSMVSLNLNSPFQECHPTPNYVQGLIGFILITLNTLKVEKIAPTEANITDCVRYGDIKHRNIDVRKALEYGLGQNMIVKQHLGRMELYVGRTERLWMCENPLGGNVEQYPNATWDSVHQFITSSEGSSALKASECRYEAALILKNSCFRTFPLGEVVRILNMLINVKQWIKHADLGWQPISITLLETHDTTGNGI